MPTDFCDAIRAHANRSRSDLVLPAIILIASGGLIGSPFQREPPVVVSIILLVCLVLFYRLRITIEDETLRASFGPGIRKRVRIAEIAGCEPIRIRWWYGWGIDVTPYGWLYNVCGFDAVAITLRDGRKFALGTDDPHGLTTAIRAGIS